MTIKVAPGLLSRIREFSDQIHLQVQGADDPESALKALAEARRRFSWP